jgi:cytochrome c553
MRRWAFRIAAFLTLIAVGGFLFAASGIMSIKASSGHWAITAWLLNFAMRRSVIMHSLAIKPPPLDDQALVLKGGAHYETGCRPCHGSPDLNQQPRIAHWMTPHPPNLSREVPKWDANELFYIVKHGVKFTGMPAWPAQKRDDEVWAMVAFLRKLPALSGDDYKLLVRGEQSQADGAAVMQDLNGTQQVPPPVSESCGRCHGVDGSGRGIGAFPKLAGQKPEYFISSMQAYALGRRSSGIMEPIAVALSRQATAELARYYATLINKTVAARSPLGHPRIGDADRKFVLSSIAVGKMENQKLLEAERNESLTSAIERGKEISMRGIPRQRVPACAECHGPSEEQRNPNYPILAGQYADYLVLQLTLFKKQARGGTAYAHLMRPVGAGLTSEQMRDVARYYESLEK